MYARPSSGSVEVAAILCSTLASVWMRARVELRIDRPRPHAAPRQVPAGVLYVRLIEAEHVPNMDIFSKTDAFAKVFVRKRNQRKSRVIFNSLHPRRAAARGSHCGSNHHRDLARCGCCAWPCTAHDAFALLAWWLACHCDLWNCSASPGMRL